MPRQWRTTEEHMALRELQAPGLAR
jgi:hypothetical protein